MMNNSVYSGGKLIGFRCFTCGGVFDKMWSCTCNGCRAKQKAEEDLRIEIKSLRETIDELKSIKQ